MAELNERLERSFSVRNELERELRDREKCISKVNELAQQGFSILLVTQTKFDEWVVLFSRPDSCDVYVKRAYSFSYNNDLTLYSVYYKEENRIFIEDIQSTEENSNREYGSFAMKELLKMAGKLKVRKINGKISPKDWDHVDRLKHFYSKFGFTVELNEASQSGRIYMEL